MERDCTGREKRTKGEVGRTRPEENTKWIVQGGVQSEVVVLTLHSFVYPPAPAPSPG